MSPQFLLLCHLPPPSFSSDMLPPFCCSHLVSLYPQLLPRAPDERRRRRCKGGGGADVLL
jgi:hypothetical protein